MNWRRMFSTPTVLGLIGGTMSPVGRPATTLLATYSSH
jgi:hypothetical protein